MYKKITMQDVMNKVVTLAQVLKRMADNKAKSWMFSNHPTNTMVVTVGKDFNIFNYKLNNTVAMLVANLLAVGSRVRLVQGNSIVTIACHDEVLIEHYRLEQVAYMFMGLYDYDKAAYAIPNGKSIKVLKEQHEGSYYYELLKETFGSTKPAVEFFNSAAWRDELQAYRWKYNLLDLIVPALCDFQEEYLLSSSILQTEVAKQRALLRMEYYNLGINNKFFNGEIPHQGVTPLEMPGIKVQQKFIEGTAPYISTTGDYEVTPNAEVEAKLVNAWFFQHEEFRVPSYDEQLKELNDLELWFDIFSTMSLTLKDLGLSTEWTGEEAEKQFDRLEELRFNLAANVGYNPELS